jgi:hypothetical protein
VAIGHCGPGNRPSRQTDINRTEGRRAHAAGNRLTALHGGSHGRSPVGEFSLSVKSACETQQNAFKAAVTAANRAGGDSAADAADNAEMQVDDYHANFTDKFKDYSSTNTLPGE